MKIPIVMSGRNAKGAGEPLVSYSDCRPLPTSYMSEHSVLGLVVDDLTAAIKALRRRGFSVSVEDFGAEIEIGSATILPELVKFLSESGIYSSIADVIDSVYQG